MMNNGSVSCDEWQLFTQLPNNTQADRVLDSDTPQWVSQQVWNVKHWMCSKIKGVAIYLSVLTSPFGRLKRPEGS